MGFRVKKKSRKIGKKKRLRKKQRKEGRDAGDMYIQTGLAVAAETGVPQQRQPTTTIHHPFTNVSSFTCIFSLFFKS